MVDSRWRCRSAGSKAMRSRAWSKRQTLANRRRSRTPAARRSRKTPGVRNRFHRKTGVGLGQRVAPGAPVGARCFASRTLERFRTYKLYYLSVGLAGRVSACQEAFSSRHGLPIRAYCHRPGKRSRIFRPDSVSDTRRSLKFGPPERIQMPAGKSNWSC